jgi:uncharacterized OB-fold protein
MGLFLTGILPEYTEKAPYIYAIIELEEGVGMPVEFIQERAGQKLVAFRSPNPI